MIYVLLTRCNAARTSFWLLIYRVQIWLRSNDLKKYTHNGMNMGGDMWQRNAPQHTKKMISVHQFQGRKRDELSSVHQTLNFSKACSCLWSLYGGIFSLILGNYACLLLQMWNVPSSEKQTLSRQVGTVSFNMGQHYRKDFEVIWTNACINVI